MTHLLKFSSLYLLSLHTLHFHIFSFLNDVLLYHLQLQFSSPRNPIFSTPHHSLIISFLSHILSLSTPPFAHLFSFLLISFVFISFPTIQFPITSLLSLQKPLSFLLFSFFFSFLSFNFTKFFKKIYRSLRPLPRLIL